MHHHWPRVAATASAVQHVTVVNHVAATAQQRSCPMPALILEVLPCFGLVTTHSRQRVETLVVTTTHSSQQRLPQALDVATTRHVSIALHICMGQHKIRLECQDTTTCMRPEPDIYLADSRAKQRHAVTAVTCGKVHWAPRCQHLLLLSRRTVLL